jgi:hypothetical protein
VQFFARIRLALDQHHAQARTRGSNRARHSGEASADHQQICTDARCHVRRRQLVSSRDAGLSRKWTFC